jgi:pimeloyl-ACP methyl ester carboxylesterase
MTPVDRHLQDGVPQGLDPRARFAALQERVLALYGVDAASRFVKLRRPAIRLHVLDGGRGEPALILHGGDGQGVDWAPLMAHLQGDFHLFALDRPGFGLSDPFDYRRVDLRRHAADVVDSTLDALGLESATMIAGSMGGFFALAAALARPERVKSLILVGMPVGLSSAAPLPLRITCAVPGATRLMMRRLSRPGTAPRKAQYVNMFKVDIANVPELYFEMQEAGLAIPGAPETWAVLLRRVARLRGIRPEVTFAEELARLAPPTLVLWGQHDMAPVEAGRAATSRIPRGRFVELDGVAHFPFLEDPARCAGLIRGFLSTKEEGLAA